MSLVGDRALSAREFLDECIEFKRRHTPAGRFFMDLLAGRLDETALRRWACDFYWYVEPAIPNIAAWLSHAPLLPQRDIYRLVGRNLAGEMGYISEREHHDLCLQFCEGLGITREHLLEHLPLATTIGAASVLGHYCRSSFEEGLGAFGLGVELNVPGRPNGAEVLYRALRDQYGLDEHTLEFFRVHIEAEEEHGENAERALLLCGQTREQQALIRRAFRFSVIAHVGMVDGYDRLREAAA